MPRSPPRSSAPSTPSSASPSRSAWHRPRCTNGRRSPPPQSESHAYQTVRFRTGSYLDFGRSGGVAERVGDAVAEGGAEFRHLGPAPGQEQTLLAPELPPDGGEGVGEGRARLAIPGIREHGRAGAAAETRGEQGHEGE